MFSTRSLNATKLSLILNCSSKSLSSKSVSADLVKPITIRTCVGIYDQLRQQSPQYYRNSPQNGLDLTVNYFDSANDPKKSLQDFDKVVVAVHGTYGYLTHFDRLIAHFRASHPNVRVIVPNLPDFAHTRSSGGAFWHSTIEKASFLKDFLHNLQVDRIDCLVSHSMGIQTTGALWGEPDYKTPIKSVALFSPQSFWIDYNRKFDAMIHSLRFQNELWYKFIELTRVHRNPYWPMKYDNINEFLLSASLFLDKQSPIDLHLRVDHLVNNTDRRVAFLHGAKDFLIRTESTAEVHKRFKICPEDITKIEPSDELQPEKFIRKNSNRRINSYVLINGGHFAYAKNHKLANKIVEDLINL